MTCGIGEIRRALFAVIFAGSMAPLSTFALTGQVIDVIAHGADSTGVTDSCSAITSAFSVIPTSPNYGATVYFPPGTYLTSCWPTISDRNITIAGAGNGSTQVTFTSAISGNAGIRFIYTNALVPQIRDISLITSVSQTNGNACVSISRPSAALSTTSPGPYISNVYCGGTGSTYWADGIVCSYCTFLSVQHTQIIGASVTGAAVGTNMSRGVFLDNTIDANIYDLHVYFANKGISLDHDSEGLKLDFSSFVMIDWGVYTEASWAAPSLVVANSHFNATMGGVYIQGGGSGGQNAQAQIHDNLIYRWLAATANPWSGISCANGATYACSDHRFSGNNIIAFQGGGPTGTAYCFNLGSNTTNVQIQGNKCRQGDYFLNWNLSTAGTIDVSSNSAQTLGTGWFASANPYAVVRDNVPVLAGPSDTPFGLVGTNATAWNLGGANWREVVTVATVPTTVTDGFGGTPGLTITVRCNDTNTTLANAAAVTKFALANGANYTCPRIGATITLRYSDQWHEIGRVP